MRLSVCAIFLGIGEPQLHTVAPQSFGVWHDACRNPKDKDTPYCRRNPTFVLDPDFASRPVRAEDKPKK